MCPAPAVHFSCSKAASRSTRIPAGSQNSMVKRLLHGSGARLQLWLGTSSPPRKRRLATGLNRCCTRVQISNSLLALARTHSTAPRASGITVIDPPSAFWIMQRELAADVMQFVTRHVGLLCNNSVHQYSAYSLIGPCAWMSYYAALRPAGSASQVKLAVATQLHANIATRPAHDTRRPDPTAANPSCGSTSKRNHSASFSCSEREMHLRPVHVAPRRGHISRDATPRGSGCCLCSPFYYASRYSGKFDQK